jgi:autophagy-related protein 2
MNFIIMDESKMVLKHIILHGISGFDRMGKMLNDLWMENVKKNQLPTVLAGLAPVKSLVNIGSGFKDLIEVPIREYKKDGRAFRSISKGAATFARNTGTELIKFGAKLAVGTQYALQGAEGMLSDQRQPQDYWDDDDLEPGERRQISLYADQPTSVMQGFRGGYRSLARDIALARDAIIAVPGEVMQSQSPGSAAAAILKRAPTIVFRPAMGVSKVVGQTLMGATNAIDPQQQRRIEEVSKPFLIQTGGKKVLTCVNSRNTRNTKPKLLRFIALHWRLVMLPQLRPTSSNTMREKEVGERLVLVAVDRHLNSHRTWQKASLHDDDERHFRSPGSRIEGCRRRHFLL